MCGDIPATNSMSDFGDSVKQEAGSTIKGQYHLILPGIGKLMTISDSGLEATTLR